MKTTPPIILIPGMQCTETMFVPMLEALRRAVPEIPRSFVRPVRQQDLASAVAEVLEGVEEPAILVGHSLGGTVAMATARKFPESVAGLVLMCSNPRAPRADQISYWKCLQDEVATGNSGKVIEQIVARLVRGEHAAVPIGHEDRWAKICQGMAEETGDEMFLTQLGLQLARIDERPGLRRFTGPVLSIAAENDALVHLDNAREAVAASHGQLEIVQDASHMAPLTRPGVVANILAEWILYQFMSNRSTTTQKVVL